MTDGLIGSVLDIKVIATPQKTLEKLAKDKNYEIRTDVAGNRSTPTKVLEKLSKDKHWLVNNPNTSTKVLEKLAYDKDCHVRDEILQRKNLPKEIKEIKEIAENTNKLYKYLV